MDPQDELLCLTEALRGYVQSCREDGIDALPRIDPDTLRTRREQYRSATAPLHQPSSASTDDVTLGKPAPTSLEDGSAAASDSLGSRRSMQREADAIAVTEAAAPRTAAPQTAAPQTASPQAKKLATLDASQERQQPAPPARRMADPAPSVSLNQQIDHVALNVLQEKVRSCVACDLHTTRTKTVFSRGTGASGICFVGEGPGAEEDAQGLPFVGAAGQLLDRMIAAMGLDQETVYVCNIVKCRPPKNRKPHPEEIAACGGYLDKQLEAINPKVIVAMGATAVQGLLDLQMGITRLRGQWRLYRGQIPVMPTFHPAYLLRQPSAKRAVWQDLQEVLREARLPVPERKN